MGKNIFTTEIKNFVKKECKGKFTDELTLLVNERFGTSYTVKQIETLKRTNGWKNGMQRAHAIKLGKANKGKKMSDETREKIKHTFFPKGGEGWHKYPIGAEIELDGYVYVKIDDKPKSQRTNWKLKHHIIYESINGPIPKGKCLIFLDQNKKNFDISNLALVEAEELLYMTRNKLVFKDSDLNKSAVLVARLETTAKRMVKKDGEKV